MYKCHDCGHIFDDGEQAIEVERHTEVPGGFNEYFAVCPICGGEFEKTKACKRCGGEFLRSELFGGDYCADCLKEEMTFETFLDYATSGVKSSSEVDTLEDFMLREIYEVDGRDQVLTCSSFVFKTFMRNLYTDYVNSDKLRQKFSGKGDLMDKICGYMTDCKLWDDFADYLYEREVRK